MFPFKPPFIRNFPLPRSITKGYIVILASFRGNKIPKNVYIGCFPCQPYQPSSVNQLNPHFPLLIHQHQVWTHGFPFFPALNLPILPLLRPLPSRPCCKSPSPDQRESSALDRTGPSSANRWHRRGVCRWGRRSYGTNWQSPWSILKIGPCLTYWCLTQGMREWSMSSLVIIIPFPHSHPFPMFSTSKLKKWMFC